MRKKFHTNKESIKTSSRKSITISERKKLRKVIEPVDLIFTEPRLEKIELPKQEYKKRLKVNRINNRKRKLEKDNERRNKKSKDGFRLM